MMLAGKKVVVVGGSSGIGLSTAELAKREGADVIIASRNAERLNAAADKLGAKAIPADVTSDESVARSVPQLRPGRSCRGHRRAAPHRSVQDRRRWKTCAPPWKASSGAPGASRDRPRSAPADR